MPKSKVTRDASIQRFEYTFELAWKAVRRVLKVKGLTINNPRDVFRAAADNQLVDDPLPWFAFLEKRNLTTHTYDEQVAEEVFAVIPDFLRELDSLLTTLHTLT